MPERAAAAPEHEPSWLVALGLLLGVAMTTLSVVGLLWRLTPASILGCLLVAIVTAGRYAWKSGARIPGAVWLAAPFMLPSLAASALPPYTWDEVAYGAALPRVRFGYRVDGRDVILRIDQSGEIFDLLLTVTLQYADRPPDAVRIPVSDPVVELRVPLAGALRSAEIGRDDLSLAEIVRN